MKFLLVAAFTLLGTSAFAQSYSDIREVQFCLKSNHPTANGVILENSNHYNPHKKSWIFVCMHPKERNFMTFVRDGLSFGFAKIEHDSDCLAVLNIIRKNPGSVFNFRIDESDDRNQRVIEFEKSKTERCDKNFDIFSDKHKLVIKS